MPSTTINGGVVPIRLWAPAHEVDSNAIRQLKSVASLPWVAHHVAVMPDVHVGKEATVGSVIAMRGAVAPAAVGVDIGCGMAAVKTSVVADDLPDDLHEIRLAIEEVVPVGREAHGVAAWERASDHLAERARSLLDRFKTLDNSVKSLAGRATLQLGSLGEGNHFIEVCID